MERSNSDLAQVESTPAQAGALLAMVDTTGTLRAMWDGYYMSMEQLAPILPEYMVMLHKHDDEGRYRHEHEELPMAQLELFFASLSVGNTRAASARAAGILPAQLRAMKQELAKPLPSSPAAKVAALLRRQRIQEFFDEIGRVEADVEQQYVRPLHDAATRPENPDLAAAKYLLERRFRDTWAPDKKVVHTGNSGGGTTINQTNTIVNAQRTVVSLSDEQLAQIEAMYRDGGASTGNRKVGNIPGQVLELEKEP